LDAIKRRVAGVDERQPHVRRQQPERLGDVEDAEHVEEVRAFLVRLRRADDDHFLDRGLEQHSVSTENASLSTTNYRNVLPPYLATLKLQCRAERHDDIAHAAFVNCASE